MYPNLLQGKRAGKRAGDVSSLNQIWVADLTYIRLPSGFCYLAAVLDAFSRRVVGWHLSKCIDGDLALAALDKALQVRQPPSGFIRLRVLSTTPTEAFNMPAVITWNA